MKWRGDVAKSTVQSFGQLTAVQINALPFKFKDDAAKRQAFERIGKLEKGQSAGPFRSDFGWHVILVVDIVPPKVKRWTKYARTSWKISAKPSGPRSWRAGATASTTTSPPAIPWKRSLRRSRSRSPRSPPSTKRATTPRGQGRGLAPGRSVRPPHLQPDGRRNQRDYDTRSNGGFFVLRVDKETPAQVTPLKTSGRG